MKNFIKEMRIVNEPGLDILEKCVVKNAIDEFLKTLGIDSIEKHDLKAWKHEEGYRNKDGSLIPYHSIDWYLQESWDERRKQLNAVNIIHQFYDEPWREAQDHYDILIAYSDMYDGSEDNDSILGMASKGIGIVISTYKFKILDNETKFRCLETLTMHELGHAFGLLPKQRIDNNYYTLDRHCTNDCVMKQGYSVKDWKVTTDKILINKRLGYSPLCSICERDLKTILKKEIKL